MASRGSTSAPGHNANEMKSGYSESTLGMHDVTAAAVPLVLESLQNMDDLIQNLLQEGKPFVFADFGAADGGMSMILFRKCIRFLRGKYGRELQIEILYEDQATSDWRALFMRLNCLSPSVRDQKENYLMDESLFPENIFISGCGRSFYSQCYPASSVHFIFSCTAMHWMSRKPFNLTTAIHHLLSTNAEENSKWKECGAKDWETILTHRAKELAKGGRGVFVNFMVDKDGRHFGNTPNIPENIFKVFDRLLRSLVEQDVITLEEYNKITFEQMLRNAEEIEAPFQDGIVKESGLRIVSHECKYVPCCYRKRWLLEGGDPVEYGVQYTKTMSSWPSGMFLKALSNERSPEEKKNIIEKLWKQHEEEVAKNPDDFGMDYVHSHLAVEKYDKKHESSCL